MQSKVVSLHICVCICIQWKKIKSAGRISSILKRGNVGVYMQLNIYYKFSVGKQRQITHAGTEMNEKDDYRLLHQRVFQNI